MPTWSSTTQFRNQSERIKHIPILSRPSVGTRNVPFDPSGCEGAKERRSEEAKSFGINPAYREALARSSERADDRDLEFRLNSARSLSIWYPLPTDRYIGKRELLRVVARRSNSEKQFLTFYTYAHKRDAKVRENVPRTFRR